MRALAPHTEAQPEAILLQLLAAFGNVIGPGPHCMVGATRHTLNLFLVLVGESSKARKGTSWNQIARLFAEVDPSLTRKQIRVLFHGHVSGASIDQALEKLSSLGVATSRFISGRGPLTTLWSANEH